MRALCKNHKHRPCISRGLCTVCYQREKKRGFPGGNPVKAQSIEERFNSKVNKIGQCHLWLGCIDTSGYGLFRVGRKLEKAHRFAWQQVNGPIENGLLVMHKCDNTKCVNIEHLSLGTYSDNNADRDLKGRFIPLQGIKHGRAKLENEDVRQIRILWEQENLTIQQIANRFSIHPTTAHKVAVRKSWKHI